MVCRRKGCFTCPTKATTYIFFLCAFMSYSQNTKVYNNVSKQFDDIDEKILFIFLNRLPEKIFLKKIFNLHLLGALYSFVTVDTIFKKLGFTLSIVSTQISLDSPKRYNFLQYQDTNIVFFHHGKRTCQFHSLCIQFPYFFLFFID